MGGEAAQVRAGVVLSGGRGTRLGGRDKSLVVVDGRTMLDRVLAALEEVSAVVVAGDPTTTLREVTFVREDPPWGGPVAGLYAALDALSGLDPDDLVAVVAVDMPWLEGDTFVRLAAAVPGRDGAVLVDADGRRQLCVVIRSGTLDGLRPGRVDGAAVHRLLSRAHLAEVSARGREAHDVDSPADLE